MSSQVLRFREVLSFGRTVFVPAGPSGAAGLRLVLDIENVL